MKSPAWNEYKTVILKALEHGGGEEMRAYPMGSDLRLPE